MKRPEFRLIRTTVVRLVIKSVLIYGLLIALVLLALYWTNSHHIDEQLEKELEQEIVELKQVYESAGMAKLVEQVNNPQQKGRIFYLQSSAGTRLAGTLLGWPETEEIRMDGRVQAVWFNDEVIPVNIHGDDAYWPVVALRFDDGSQLLVAQNTEQAESLQEALELLLDAMGIAIFFAVLIAIMSGREILRRMDIIGATASEIMAGDLSRRIPLSDRQDEFDTLARRLNAMLDRQQQLIKGIRDVTDNVAHDLRSPLTRMRTQMEIALLEPRSVDEYRQILDQSIEDLEGLIRTFQALLSISQAEAGSHRTLWGAVDLTRLARDLQDLYTPLAEDKQQKLQVQNGHDAVIYGSRDLLAQSFGNLLENAIKYTPEGGVITLHVGTRQDQVDVIVADNGPGIPDEELNRVLEKFVRLEGSRHTPGNGLGLSLVQAVARLHKAELVLENSHPGLRVVQRFNRKNKPSIGGE